MKKIKISQLKEGDKLYRVRLVDGKVISYTIEKIDDHWFHVKNDITLSTAPIHCLDLEGYNINDEYYLSPFVAIWMRLKSIRKEQYLLEKKRLQIIKENKYKVTISKPSKEANWFNKLIRKIFKKS